MTLNPIKSIDPVLTILLPGMLFFVLPAVLGTPPLMFGGAKPVPYNMGRLRHPYRDMMWVALVYAIIGSTLTHTVGRALSGLNYQQQRYEANFRFDLVCLL